MVATLLRCILSLQSIDSINTSTIWAIRETVRFTSKVWYIAVTTHTL